MTPGPEEDAPHPSVHWRDARKSNSSRGLPAPGAQSPRPSPAPGVTACVWAPAQKPHGQTACLPAGGDGLRGTGQPPPRITAHGAGVGGLRGLSSEVARTPASISALRRTSSVSLKRALSPLT